MRVLNWLMALLCVMVVAACGGGGGGAGTAPFSPPNPGVGGGVGNVSLVLSISSTTVSSTEPATVIATVLDAQGAPYAGQLVTFESIGGLGGFSANSVLTDSAGMATVTLSPASSVANGADLVQATVTLAGSSAATAPTSTIGFQVVGGSSAEVGDPSIALSLSTSTVSAVTPATLSVTIKNGAGVGVPGQVVSFSSPGNLGTFTPSSALTDASGVASVTVSAATAATNGADLAVAQATVNGTLVTGSVGFSVVSATVAPVGTPSIALALSTNVVTIATPATATATVRDSTGVGIANQVVKFSTVDGLGSPSPASALTNSNGVASVQLTPVTANTSGADQILAATTVNGTALQASQGFQLTANNVAIASFTSDKSTLNSYDQATLTVALSGTISGTPVNVAVSSACVSKAKASLTPAIVTTTTGSATFTYRDLGCGATDTADSLQASIAGTSATKTLSLGLTAPTAASITFASATPTTIFLKGSGLTETSTVVFKVVDTAGNGLQNQSVDLAPTTLSGGLTLDSGTSQVTKLSDSLGNVSVLINSGTVPTPVRVKATLTGTTISTVSSNLAVAVGLPSQLNFSLSQQTINIEGYDVDGTTNTYSIIASDRLANPVPLDTAINFVAEGGQVEPIKFTTLASGLARATANFISAEPRPLDGRLTVVAYAIGEESFIDLNGNNVWDAGEPFQDLGNIYIDRLFDGIYQSSTDQFISLALPGATAATCAPTPAQLPLDKRIPSVGGATCDGNWGRAYVRRAAETVLSTSVSRPVWLAPPRQQDNQSSALYAVPPSTCAGLLTPSLITEYSPAGVAEARNFYQVGGNGLYGLPIQGSLTFLAADNNQVRFNPVAAGSTITVTATTGITATATGSPVPSTSTPHFAGVNYEFDSATSGTITISITSPRLVTTSVSQFVSTLAAPVGASNCQ